MLGLPAGGVAVAADSGVGITDLRTWSAPEHTRLVLDLDGKPTYQVRRDGGDTHLLLEIRGATNRAKRSEWTGIDGRVRRVVITRTAGGTQVDVTLAGRSPYKHFSLPPYGSHKPHRIVLDVYNPRPGTVRPAHTEPPPAPAEPVAARPFVVVIDAGHGGEDPGAIGRYYRTQEKAVALEIAWRLKRAIDAMPGMRAELTRRGDYFIPLAGRIRKADALGGDLFVSIHADMSRDRHTRGTHVYTLAPRSARDRQAVRVARMENASDFMGGVEVATRLPIVFDRDGSPNNTVESRVLARLSLGRLKDVNDGGREGRRSEARFWVLKGNRPSVLVETGFLSNREDESNLRSSGFQQQLAADLAQAVRDYYEIRVRGGSVVHTVHPGETLSHIALHYGVGVPDLLSANRIGSAGVIRPGDRLLVPRQGWPVYQEPAPRARPVSLTGPPSPVAAPAPRPEPAAAPARHDTAGHHRVRRGENLTVIAQAHGVRLSDLMRANGLNPRSALRVGQTLAVPAPRPDDRVHVVASGETLSGLAAHYHVSLSRLAEVNDLRTRARLWVGQRLILPGVGPAPVRSVPSAHTVRRGESLSGLAARYGVSQGRLARANGVGLWAELKVGQRLTIPGGTGPVEAREHRVGNGETLSGLAARYGLPLSELARANGLSTRAELLRGQRLVIPASGKPATPRVHVIRQGESLGQIASAFGVSVDALVSTNALRDADRLMAGGRLLIPR